MSRLNCPILTVIKNLRRKELNVRKLSEEETDRLIKICTHCPMDICLLDEEEK